MRPFPMRRIAALAVLALFLAPGGTSAQDPGQVCFFPGERLTYDIKWSIFPAGRVVLEVLPDEEMDGRTVRHFAMTAKTNSFVDAFYKVRDRVDAWT
ncbi:MAG: DUF3108 domain-containing protein, partial [Pseudomonadota bacterium]